MKLFYRDVVGLTSDQKTQKRDPRFDSLCGEFDAKVFKDSYKFGQDIKSRELKDLKEQLKVHKGKMFELTYFHVQNRIATVL